MGDNVEKYAIIKEEYSKGKSYREIGEILGLSYATVIYHAKKLGIISRKPWHKCIKYEFNINEKYGKLLIIDKIYNKEKKQNFYQCVCDCGQTDWFYKDSLLGGQPQCWECHKLTLSNKFFKGYEDISLTYWTSLEKHAKDRKIKFLIKIEDTWNVFVKQEKKCVLSGLDITLLRSSKKGERQTASLDRIDSDKDYTLDNIQWIHKDINRMKMNLEEKQFIEYCKLIAQKHNEHLSKIKQS